MSDVIELRPTQHYATEAESLTARLEDHGVTVWMVQLTSSRAFLAFEPTTIPSAPVALDIMSRMRARFLAEPRFARDLFGWLFAIGQVLQLYAEHQPRIRLD